MFNLSIIGMFRYKEVTSNGIDLFPSKMTRLWYHLPQSQQQTQTTDIQEKEIRMSIYLPYVESTSEKI